ncbi:hypothetical protein [Pseudonocardia sp. TRM90224]|uniref:hypothetical protein n=1 Tax=Pseudonocardia sp. TRM90224 TaxID=2812678 RepID=UPI001E3F139D|nr:hypothetical protein [Pseudonocardia sp. TRM90224]
MTITCPGCSHAVPLAEFLGACTAFSPALGTVQWQCPSCASTTDFRPVDGAVELGYVYAAGAAHFAAMDSVPTPGLAVRREPTRLVVTHGTGRWTFAG